MQNDITEVAAVAEQSSASRRAGLGLHPADQRLHAGDRLQRPELADTAEQLEQLVAASGVTRLAPLAGPGPPVRPCALRSAQLPLVLGAGTIRMYGLGGLPAVG